MMDGVEIIGVEMNDTENDSFKYLIEEYKLCQQKATTLERNVYTTATIFVGGSVTGLATLLRYMFQESDTQSNIPNDLLLIAVFILGLLAIAAWFSWERLSFRWLCIANVMFIRMEHIERNSEFRVNLYVRYLDEKSKMEKEKKEHIDNSVLDFFSSRRSKKHNIGKPFLIKKLMKNLDDNPPEYYEYRSQWAMLQFLSRINISAWLLVIVIQALRFLTDGFPAGLIYNRGLLSGLLILFIGFFVYLRKSWKKP
jgi:hypothetical protein